MEDLHLATGAGSRTDANRGQREPLGDHLGDGSRDHFKDHREASGLLESASLLQEARSVGCSASLDTVAAQCHVRLRRQPNVAHDGDAGVDERAHLS